MFCQVCEGEIESLGNKFDVPIGCCHLCGSISAACEEPQQDFYEDSYFGGGPYGYFDENRPTLNVNALDASALRRITFLNGVSKVIEVGAGGGSFVKAGLNFGLNMIGVERSLKMRNNAQKSYGIQLYSEIPSMPDGAISIALIEVIEHVKSPQIFLNQL